MNRSGSGDEYCGVSISIKSYTTYRCLLSLSYCFLERVDPEILCQDEPKFIVFYSMLVLIFSMFCFKCRCSKPSLTMKQQGTMVTVYQHCFSFWENAFVWWSQPLVLGKYPAGILLSFAVLMAGASISKILLVFKHMRLCVYNIRTYFIHQDKLLFQVVLSYWETSFNSLESDREHKRYCMEWWWPLWLDGALSKIWCIYHILLYFDENCSLWGASGKFWKI